MTFLEALDMRERAILDQYVACSEMVLDTAWPRLRDDMTRQLRELRTIRISYKASLRTFELVLSDTMSTGILTPSATYLHALRTGDFESLATRVDPTPYELGGVYRAPDGRD